MTLIGMAANFGSAFTPFGNTHNIFLMNHFHIPLLDFFKLSVPLLIASVILLIGFVAFVRKAPVPTVPVQDIRIMARPTIITCGVALVIFTGVMGWLRLGSEPSPPSCWRLVQSEDPHRSRLRHCADLRRLLRHHQRVAPGAVDLSGHRTPDGQRA